MSEQRGRHPLISVEYDVLVADLPIGISDAIEEIVPIGHDDMGNLRADHYGPDHPDDGKILLWSEDVFVEMVQDNNIEVAHE